MHIKSHSAISVPFFIDYLLLNVWEGVDTRFGGFVSPGGDIMNL